MSELAELVKDLSKKLDNLQDLPKKFENLRADVENIKRSAKKKKSKKHSRRSRKSRSRSRSTTTPPSQPSNSRGHSTDSRSGAHGGSARSRSRTRGHSSHHGRSRSPIRTPSPARRGVSPVRQARSGSTTQVLTSTHRDWEDIPEYPDYNEVLQFPDDSETKGRPTSKVAEVSETTEALLKNSCTKRLANNTRLKIRDCYSLPQVAATRTPQLDNYLKPEVSQQTKTADKELAKVQTFVLDSLAPLSHLMELDAQGHEITHTEAIDTVKAAIELIGNANAKISHLRRSKVITQLNKSLLPLIEEDSNFDGVAPSLFGPEFARKSKEHVEQVKALRSSAGAKDSKQPFFRQGPPGGTSEDQGEEAPRLPRRATGSPSKDPSGANELFTCMRAQLFNNKLQKYSCMSYQGSGGGSHSTNRPTSSREAKFSPTELVCDNSGSVDPKHGTRVPHRLHGGATPTVSSHSSSLPLQPESTDSRRAIQPYSKTSNQAVGTSLRVGLLFQHLSGSQKEWGAETSYQPQSPESVC